SRDRRRRRPRKRPPRKLRPRRPQPRRRSRLTFPGNQRNQGPRRKNRPKNRPDAAQAAREAGAVRRRLDAGLVRRGLVRSREQAQQAIDSGRVLVGGAPADKPARMVAAGEPVELVGQGPRFVSRGGEKLDAALDHFAIDVGGARALDAGASTGG